MIRHQSDRHILSEVARRVKVVELQFTISHIIDQQSKVWSKLLSLGSPGLCQSLCQSLCLCLTILLAQLLWNFGFDMSCFYGFKRPFGFSHTKHGPLVDQKLRKIAACPARSGDRNVDGLWTRFSEPFRAAVIWAILPSIHQQNICNPTKTYLAWQK